MFSAVAGASLLGACAAPSSSGPAAGASQLRVTGTVAYRERIALDPAAEQLLFINDTQYSVLTQGNGTSANLVLVRVTQSPR